MINIKINKELYSLKTLESAKEMYANLAYINRDEDSKYWILSFSKCKYDEMLTIREFENYLIGLENTEK